MNLILLCLILTRFILNNNVDDINFQNNLISFILYISFYKKFLFNYFSIFLRIFIKFVLNFILLITTNLLY